MYNRMGPELSMRLKGTVSATANLQDILLALDAVFLELHPLFERRLEWFDLEKNKDMTTRQIFYHIQRQFDEADMDKMTRSEWLMFRLSFVCRHESGLFHEIMKVKNPTLETILEAATAFEHATKAREKAVPKMTYHVEEVDNTEVQILAIPEGGCQDCGLIHATNKCSAVGRKCFDCGVLGHLGRVCRARKNDSDNGDSRG